MTTSPGSPTAANEPSGRIGGHLLTRQRHPDRAGLAHPVQRVDGRRAGALGEPVPLDDREAEPGLAAAQQLPGTGAAPHTANRTDEVSPS